MNIRSSIVAVGDEFECPHCGHMIGALNRAYTETDVPGGEVINGWFCSPACLKDSATEAESEREWEKGRADRLSGEPCKSANGAYLEGWYSLPNDYKPRKAVPHAPTA